MDRMEHNAEYGHISLGVAFIGWVLAKINISEALKDASTVIAIIAGLMAIVNYYYSIKKNKNGK